ncbi:MAG TPA: glycosyltransferase family 39 protein [Chthoniobacterales bacterium]|nr:glycosyltransferase family 39 protein [Chthoniobacterales bacterium]
MSRLPSWLLVVVAWAAIYLPGLGSFEIKGEEGRRILPAVAMLESGNYLVPTVGGAAYYRKPPLVNWLVAVSFKLFGHRNEWTARAPSVVCVLAVALAFLTVARGSVGSRGATIAALVWLTNFGMIEKGRLIEIEALYISLCALAIICWLSWWEQKRSPWLTWTVPWIFLGLGWLAKGPTLLFFFYAVVVAVLWRDKQWRFLIHPAHLVGWLIMLAVFGLWAVPFLQTESSPLIMRKWLGQYAGRVTGEFLRLANWFEMLSRSLIYFLPWLVFVPWLRLRRFAEARQRDLARALAWSIVVPFLLINLTPGMAPRYCLPVLVPFCLLTGLSFAEHAFAPLPWLKQPPELLWSRVGQPLVAFVAAAVLVGYPLAAAMIFKHRPKVKNMAEQINSIVPRNELLYAVDPNYQPFLFYVDAAVRYVSSVAELPPDTHYFLVLPEDEESASNSQQWRPRRARPVLRFTDYRYETVILFAVESS